MDLIYINIEQAIEIHRKTVEISGGGITQSLNTGQLESVLQNIQNDNFYPTYEEKLTHLIHSSINFHCFADGNKRIGIALGADFLLKNGYLYVVESFMRVMENISYHVAAGKIEKELLFRIVTAIINESYEDDEVLKLEIINATY